MLAAPSPLPPSRGQGRFEQRERPLEHAALFGGQGFERLGPNADFRFVDRVEAGAGWNQVAEDDVLLETHEVIGPAGQRRLGEHLGGFLEAGGRDEAGALHRRLGDAQQLRRRGGPLRPGALGQLAAERFDLRVGLIEHVLRHDRADGELAVALFGDLAGTGRWRRSPGGSRTYPSRCRAAAWCRRGARCAPSAACARR